MKKIQLFVVCLITCLFGASFLVHAEDIDVYADNSGATGVPNVLLILDNAANFSSNAGTCTYSDGTAPSLNGTAGGIEQCAIYNVISSLPADTVNIGLMVYNANNIRDINNANCGGSDGGCLVQPLTLMSGTAKANFLAWIKTWKTDGGAGDGYIKANGEATGSVMQEAWAYYAGRTGLSGRSYAGIQPTAGCQKNFVIFIGNAFTTAGTPGDGGSASPRTALTSAPGVTSGQLTNITVPSGSYGTTAFSCGSYTMGNHTESSGLYADEWARYMYQTDIYGGFDGNQGITTYTVGLLGTSCKPDYPALMTSMAKYGGGKYFATSSYDEISTAILKILNEVQAVNSVFSSASLPVSVNAQGTYLNQIFLGMFRPDSGANPRWLGNLKQYQFILEYPDPTNPDPNTATLKLGDSNGNAAISTAGTGFITPDAVSFWSRKEVGVAPDSTGGFFVNDQRGSGLAFDAPDGELVEKGGAAQRSRVNNLSVDYLSTPSSPRRLYTYCPGGSSCSSTLTASGNAFATTNAAITDAMLSASSPISVSSIVRSGTTATVTTSSNHGLTSGDTVSISGANQSEYNGNKASVTVTGATTFTFTVPEYPVTPALGTYSASRPGAPQTVTSITRSGSTATVTLPGHGFTSGQSVTISGATQAQYNGTFTVTPINVNSFSYTLTEGPVSPAGGGTAKVGSTTRNIEAYNSNPTPGVVRATGSTTVTVTTTANHGFSAGNQVTISGVADASNVAIPEYNIGPVSIISKTNKSFTYAISATTPTSPATGTITADGSGNPKTITSLTRVGTIATATAAAHGFTNGQTVNIGGTAGTNESAYVGSFVVSGVTTNTFNFTVVTTPTTPATGTITVSKSGSIDRTALINWVRGEDNFGDEASPGSGYTVRPSVHGDVLHSRPVVVNYGDGRGLVVYYGANDGIFRAVNGSQATNIPDNSSGVKPGEELWGLVLPEFFGKLNRQRINSPELKLPSTALASAQPKDYFMDGSAGVFQQLKADGTIDKAYLYLTMRRGGRFIYALDVTEPTDPKFMWKVSSTDTGFSELGQTWSRPRVTLVNGYANPVVVFGAGYDTAEDSEPPVAGTMGRGVFVLDAATGARVWSAGYTAGATSCSGNSTQAACGVSGMNWSIPSDISFVDRDNDGKTDRFYAPDMGGNVWRVDLEPAGGNTPDKWQVTKLAALGCSAGTCSSGTTPRKFFFPPSVLPVGVTGGVSSYDVVLLGSGDREHPLKSTATGSSYNVTNRFYAIKDTITGKDSSTATTITEATLFDASTEAYNGTLKGFYTTYATGEKSVNASLTIRGTTFFGTNRPTPPSLTSCSSNLGEAKGYALNPFTGAYDFTIYDGGGLPPTPTAGIVTISTAKGDVKKEFCVGCGGGGGGGASGDCKSALGACTPTKAVPKNIRRTYWYKK
ncbi:PilC/PilY family type IV pilus protein [Polaromonas sp. YR568]|uniref:PilC/PilY family type IV pilus protein n=1 Tax=Polaromonas sp. YR568 TaxID=1855301 RepID=UPI0031381C89